MPVLSIIHYIFHQVGSIVSTPQLLLPEHCGVAVSITLYFSGSANIRQSPLPILLRCRPEITLYPRNILPRSSEITTTECQPDVLKQFVGKQSL